MGTVLSYSEIDWDVMKRLKHNVNTAKLDERSQSNRLKDKELLESFIRQEAST